MHPMLNTAVKAARRAGNIIVRASRNLDIVAVREKAANDFVSEVDREAEQAIILIEDSVRYYSTYLPVI